MAARFEIKKNDGGMFHFSLRAANGEIIFSSETYETRHGCESGIASVVKNAANDAHYERHGGDGGNAYFVLRAGNNETIGRSETYSSMGAMEKGIEAVKTNAAAAVIVDLTD